MLSWSSDWRTLHSCKAVFPDLMLSQDTCLMTTTRLLPRFSLAILAERLVRAGLPEVSLSH